MLSLKNTWIGRMARRFGRWLASGTPKAPHRGRAEGLVRRATKAAARWLGLAPRPRRTPHPGLMLWALFFLWETLGVRAALGAGLSLPGLLDDLALVGLFLAIFAGLEALPPLPRGLLSALLGLTLAAFVLANALYFSFFRTFINVDSILLLTQVPDTSSSLWPLMTPTLLISAVGVPATLITLALLRGSGAGPRRSGVLVMTGALLALPTFAVGSYVRSPAFTPSENSPLALVARQGFDRVAAAWRENADEMRRRLAERYADTWNLEPGYRLGDDPRYPLLRTPVKGDGPGIGVKNVVVVLMESVRDWETGVGTRLPTVTPNLHRMAQEGVAVTPFYANGHQTVRGEAAVLCSMLPNTGGGQIYGRFPRVGTRCLPEILADRGYATHWISSYLSTYGNKKEFLTHHGVMQVHDRDELMRRPLKHPQMGWGPSDEDLMDFAVDVLDASQQPFFAEIMTLSNHHPYNHGYGIPRPTAYETDGEPEVYRDYLHGLHYTDWAIGRFMAQARTRPWFDDTLFVFLGDHGQWHFPTGPRAPFTVQQVEAYFRLPFVLYAPGHLAPRTVHEVASQIDVAPTILDLLGVAEPNAFVGVSVFADIPSERRFAFMGYENGWSIRVGEARCYNAGRTCFEDEPPYCPTGAASQPRPHACFTYEGDLLEASRRDGDRFHLLGPDQADALVRRGLRLMDAKAFLLRSDGFYPRAPVLRAAQ